MIISPDIEGILKRLVLLPADLNRKRLIMKNLDKKIDNRPKIERILFKDFKPKSGECLLELFLNVWIGFYYNYVSWYIICGHKKYIKLY